MSKPTGCRVGRSHTGHDLSPPSVGRKKITAVFNGDRISSDGGVMLLALAERRMGIADRLAAEIADRRDPARIVQVLAQTTAS